MRNSMLTWLWVVTCVAVGAAAPQQFSARLGQSAAAAPIPTPSAAAPASQRQMANPAVALAHLGAIGDFIWYDADDDGIEDIGEPGIPNVPLALYLDSDGSGTLTLADTLLLTTTTGADGGYLFADLADGTYLVDVVDAANPNGTLNGLQHVIGNQSQPEPSTAISVGGGYIYRDADFGYRLAPGDGQAVVGDVVWFDGNGDGVQQPNEPGIPAVGVCATPSVGGAAICATTDANGRYLLNVPYGAYTIAPTSGIPSGLTPATAASKTVVIAVSQQLLTADFGYTAPSGALLGSIGDLVFGDVNTNGVFDSGDGALAGVSVDLIWDRDGNQIWDPGEPLIATAISSGVLDGNGGNYSFRGVPSGNYLIRVSATNAILVDYVKSPLGSVGVNNHNQADPYPVSLPAGGANRTADFGFHLAGLPDSGVIGNLVWVETDADGIFEMQSRDVGQAGVTIELALAGEIVATTTTGASGRYSFLRLPAAAYSVTVADDFGVLAGLGTTLPAPHPGQDNNNQAQPFGVILGTDAYAVMADFGYYKPSRLAAIGDIVWYDANGNGVEDVGEPGIPNVRIAIYLDADGSGSLTAADALMATAVTDSLGGYLLSGLPAGTYFVDVQDAVNPNGPLNGLTHSIGMQSQPDPTAPINLAAGQIYKDADFGYGRTPATGKALIGDRVWYDGNGDGIPQPAEPGIAGVTVAITDSNGARIATDVTDAAGRYLIEVPVGSGYVVGPDAAASPALTGLHATGIAPAFLPPLVSDQQWLDARLGFWGGAAVALRAAGVQAPQGAALGTLGDLVFLDADTNGVFGAGDSPLAGVTVVLIRDSNGNHTWDTGEPIIATASTGPTLDAGGNYLFSGVPAGNYLVHVNDTVGILADYAHAPLGTAGVNGQNQADPYPVTVASGMSNLTADFGYTRTAGLNAGIIGGTIWGEMDGDGVFSLYAGDVGLAGVTVALLQNADVIATLTTAADGSYAFTGLPAGSYQVQVSDDFGVLVDYSTTALGPLSGQDNNNQAQPYTVMLANNGNDATADFGYRTGLGLSDVTYAITAQGWDLDVRPNSVVSFTIRITNTGAAWITYLPLQVTYSTIYLSYLGALPPSNDDTDDGLIQWRDLTGGGDPLAPGNSRQVVVTFRGLRDTSSLPGSRATATATVRGAWANRTGATIAGSDVLLPEGSGTAGVRIFAPTGVGVTRFGVGPAPGGVAVKWATANEASIMGFAVLRRPVGGGAYTVVTPELLVAEHAGTNQGDAYQYVDLVATGAAWEYAVQVVLLDGRTEQVGPARLAR